VDPAGQLGVDLQDLPDLAVLRVRGLRAGVLQRQAVLTGTDGSAAISCRGRFAGRYRSTLGVIS